MELGSGKAHDGPLAPVPTQKVKDRYASIVAANLAVSDHDVSLGHLLDMDYFWVSVTLAEMGIPPMLGPKRVKWFCVVNHRESRRSAAKRGAPVAAQFWRTSLYSMGSDSDG